MTKIHFAACVLIIASCGRLFSGSTNAPDFDEVKQLIRSNLTGVADADLNRAALDGLLQGFRGKIRLIGNETAGGAKTISSNISRSSVLDGGIACVQIARVTVGLQQELSSRCSQMNATNKIRGVVLDLRFADGDDYAAAAAIADMFIADERDLLDWGKGFARSTVKEKALDWPVAVLVNSETTGAPEALAAVMRETGTGLIFGNTTRGAAMTGKDFVLSNGQQLRIASSPVKLAHGELIPATGVVPDIRVAVTLVEERAFLDDSFAGGGKTIAVTNSSGVVTNQSSSTNRPVRRPRPTEADLVRARREGVNFDGELLSAREDEPEKPEIRDPALARAVDVLKGLAVVRRAKP